MVTGGMVAIFIGSSLCRTYYGMALSVRCEKKKEETEDNKKLKMTVQQQEERGQECIAASFMNMIKLCIDIHQPCMQ